MGGAVAIPSIIPVTTLNNGGAVAIPSIMGRGGLAAIPNEVMDIIFAVGLAGEQCVQIAASRRF